MQNKNVYAGRINSLDVYRGIALACVIFFHTAIYSYGGMSSIDFDNPPLFVVLFATMGLWGGIFIMLSLITSSLSIQRNLARPSNNRRKVLTYTVYASGLYILLHYALSFLLGRWELSLGSANNPMTLTAELLRNNQIGFPEMGAFFDGSVLSTIGLNLLLLGALMYALFRKPSVQNEKRAYVVLGSLTALMVFVSFSRMYLYPAITTAVESENYLTATVLGWLLGSPYPVVTYSLYGLFGAIIGVMVHHDRLHYIRRYLSPIGVVAVIAGIIGCLSLPVTIGKADLFWQWKAIMDLGIFLLIAVFALGIVQPMQRSMRHYTIFIWISRISLTIYLLETTMSEILRSAWFMVLPGWNLSYVGTSAFAVFHVLWWFMIVYLWSRIQFRYSLEYFWTKFFRTLGKRSTKLERIQHL